MGIFNWLFGSDDDTDVVPCRHDFEVVERKSSNAVEQDVIRDERETERAALGLPPGPPIPPMPTYPYSDARTLEKKVCLKCCLVVDEIEAVRQWFLQKYRGANDRHRRAHEILNNQ